MQMKQKLIYKNESIKKFKSEFKKNQSRVYTSFGVDRNTKYKGEWKNGKQEGKGELIEYDSHQDEGGKILNRYIGTFKNGKFVK